jgi:hypothetical protein
MQISPWPVLLERKKERRERARELGFAWLKFKGILNF